MASWHGVNKQVNDDWASPPHLTHLPSANSTPPLLLLFSGFQTVCRTAQVPYQPPPHHTF
ncbi:hypothetical protein VDGL01_09616 [Verticillium dahliae]